MTSTGGNLFDTMAAAGAQEQVTELLRTSSLRIERIVSHAHASPPGFWYDQDWNEWVLVLRGAAAVLFEGEAAPRILRAGEHLDIPAHTRHRVEWTDPDAPTVWLAVHYRKN